MRRGRCRRRKNRSNHSSVKSACYIQLPRETEEIQCSFFFHNSDIWKIILQCSSRISRVWSVRKHGCKDSFPIGVDQQKTKDRPESGNEHGKVEQKSEMKRESQWEIIEWVSESVTSRRRWILYVHSKLKYIFNRGVIKVSATCPAEQREENSVAASPVGEITLRLKSDISYIYRYSNWILWYWNQQGNGLPVEQPNEARRASSS